MAITKTNVFKGRPQSIVFTGTTGPLTYSCIKSDNVTINEEYSVTETELADGTKLHTKQATEIIVEGTIDELVQTEIDYITDDCTGVVITVPTPGPSTPGTTKTFTIADADLCLAHIEDTMTKFVIKKSACATDTAPYTEASVTT